MIFVMFIEIISNFELTDLICCLFLYSCDEPFQLVKKNDKPNLHQFNKI